LRLSQIPALVNCSTIIVFDQWSKESLLQVALQELNVPNIGMSSHRPAVAKIAVEVHKEMLDASFQS